MKLYYYPRSTFSQKVLLAFYEKQIAFTPVVIYPGNADDRAELRKLTPLVKVPLLVLENGWKIPESTIIIEYIDAHATGPRLIPEDRDLARQTRFHDRIADLYVTEPYNTIVRESDAVERVAKARERLDAMLAGLDQHLANRTWVMGDSFTLADCSLVPTLAAYGHAHPFERFKHVSAYLSRALERPSVARMRREHETFAAKAAS
jgi:glutathione S-transferase